jgi:MFS family permease
VGCLLLAMNAFSADPKIWVLFVVSFFMSAVNGLHRPALESITQQIVEKEDYSLVGALVTFKYSVCMIVGPAIGGLLIAHLGIGITYVVDLVTFLASVIALLKMTSTPKPVASGDTQSTWHSIKQGFQYAASRQELLGSYFVDFVAMVFGMPIALFPAIAQHHGGPRTLGLLYSAPAVGALIVSFISGWTVHIKRHGVGISVAALMWGVSIILFGVSDSLWWGLFFLAWAGAFDALSGIFRQTMWNETIPQDYRGRLAGIEMISYLSGPKLGDTEAGLVAAAFGITFSIISGGVLCVLGVGVCCYYLPKFWRYESTVTQSA